MKKSKKKAMAGRISAALLSIFLAGVSGGAVRAAEFRSAGPDASNQSTAERNGYTNEQWERLMDDVLEYEEITDLVHNFNPSVVSARSQKEDSVHLMQTIADNLRARKRDMQNLKQKAEAAGENEAYQHYKMQEMLLKKTADSLEKGIQKTERKGDFTNREIRALERDCSHAAKRLMISYHALFSRSALLSESLEHYRNIAEWEKQKMKLGISTARELSRTEVEQSEIKAQCSDLDRNVAEVKKNLMLLCGWNEAANPTIGEIPEADGKRMDEMNPDSDLKRAIANNREIIDFRHENHVKSSASWSVRENSEQEMNENLLSNLKTLYGKIEEEKALAEAAESGFLAAEIKKAAADVKYGGGLLSEAQYIGELLHFREAKTACFTAKINLFQAMENYDFALQGDVSEEE